MCAMMTVDKLEFQVQLKQINSIIQSTINLHDQKVNYHLIRDYMSLKLKTRWQRTRFVATVREFIDRVVISKINAGEGI